MRSPYFHHAQATTLRPMFLLKISFPKISSLKKYKIPKNCVTPFFSQTQLHITVSLFCTLGHTCSKLSEKYKCYYRILLLYSLFYADTTDIFFSNIYWKKRVNLIVMMIIKGKRDDLLYVTIFFFFCIIIFPFLCEHRIFAGF